MGETFVSQSTLASKGPIMKRIIAGIAMAAAVGSGSIALAQQKSPATAPSKSPATTQQAATKAPAEATAFAKKVAAANAFEIQTSELAKTKGQSTDVKSFADKMVSDHTKAGENFKAALQSANITGIEEKLDAKKQAVLSLLQKLNGASFDNAYAKAQLDAHKEAVALVRSYSKSGKTPALKDWAGKTLPTLEEHLKSSTDISKRVPKA